MRYLRGQTGATLLEVMAALVLFALAATGLAAALPMAHERTDAWRARQNLARSLESQLEDVRSRSFAALAVGDSGWQADGAFRYRTVTSWVQEGLDGAGKPTWLTLSPGTGDGLFAVYYDKEDFTDPKVRRIDPDIDFDWGNRSPDPLIQQNWFSARWTGYLYAPQTGTYRLFTRTDDGARLWINNQLLIDNWESPVTNEVSGMIDLSGPAIYPLRLEYFEGGGSALARLSWSGPGIAKQIIPTGNLFSQLAKMTRVTVGYPDKPETLQGRLFSFADEVSATPTSPHVYVGDIELTGSYWIVWTATARVTIRNHLGQPAAGAVVSGHWTHWWNTTEQQATTDNNGVATFSRLYSFLTGSVTFTVDNVQANFAYDPTKNVKTSDQTTW